MRQPFGFALKLYPQLLLIFWSIVCGDWNKQVPDLPEQRYLGICVNHWLDLPVFKTCKLMRDLNIYIAYVQIVRQALGDIDLFVGNADRFGGNRMRRS